MWGHNDCRLTLERMRGGGRERTESTRHLFVWLNHQVALLRNKVKDVDNGRTPSRNRLTDEELIGKFEDGYLSHWHGQLGAQWLV